MPIPVASDSCPAAPTTSPPHIHQLFREGEVSHWESTKSVASLGAGLRPSHLYLDYARYPSIGKELQRTSSWRQMQRSATKQGPNYRNPVKGVEVIIRAKGDNKTMMGKIQKQLTQARGSSLILY